MENEKQCTMNRLVGQVASRYGAIRSIIEIEPGVKYHMVGQSVYCREMFDDKGNVTLFDFEGGPCLTIGSVLRVEGQLKEISHISADTNPSPEDEKVSVCVVEFTVIPHVPKPPVEKKEETPNET